MNKQLLKLAKAMTKHNFRRCNFLRTFNFFFEAVLLSFSSMHVSSIQFSSTFTFVDASFVLLARKILSMQSFTVHLVPISTFMENTCSNSTSTTSTVQHVERSNKQPTSIFFYNNQTTKQLSHFHHLFPTIKIKLQWHCVALLLASFKQYPIIERV